MPASVMVYRIRSHHRSDTVCSAMVQGIKRCGDRVKERFESQYCQRPEADIAVFYGLEGNLRTIFQHYQREGHRAVYVDLGYWGRREGGRWSGYHKVVVNSRHPTAYFQKRNYCPTRFHRFGIKPKEWQGKGRHILLAGMGAKGSWAEGFGQEDWERAQIQKIKAVTDIPIIYRPKPSWKDAQPILGSIYSPRTEPLEAVLNRCHAVVSHHSNVSVDGILEGIPAYTWDGVARCMSGQDLSTINEPYKPDGREQWAANLAWCQWSIAEMQRGLPWKHLKDEGLL